MRQPAPARAISDPFLSKGLKDRDARQAREYALEQDPRLGNAPMRAHRRPSRRLNLEVIERTMR